MARKPASRGASRSSRKPERQVPAWVWVFTGVVCGGFVVFLYHLATLRGQAPDMAGQNGKPVVEKPAETVDTGPRFDFYAVLPKMEVIVPKGEDDPQPSRRTPPADAGTDGETEVAAADRQEQYLLQAGSFRRNDDADRRRGELILHGLTARVQPVSMGNGDTWYRVMVGPFDNANAAHRAQDKLASAGIETLAIRAKKD
jgi:cell division protein FtsN